MIAAPSQAVYIFGQIWKNTHPGPSLCLPKSHFSVRNEAFLVCNILRSGKKWVNLQEDI